MSGKKEEFESAEFLEKNLGEICGDTLNSLLEPSTEDGIESSEFTK